MNNRQRYPKGEQNFSNIIREGKVYVDKTALIYELVTNEKYAFLARPRRFGKSLLLSTIESYFKGEKDLFKGLAIETLEKEWKNYPVFHLEFSRINPEDRESLFQHLSLQISYWEKEYEIKCNLTDLTARFANLIIQTSENTGSKIVVLVDEYDNPLLNTLSKGESHEHNRTLLKSLYSNIKALDKHIRFAMLTGVSRFSRMTVFSGFNNLTDISFDRRYADICGFTEKEIIKDLRPGVVELGKELGKSTEEAMRLLKEQYDGYHFSKNSPDIYNPYSLLLALDKQEIDNYWIQTATPEFLIEKLKGSPESFEEIFQGSVKESLLAEPDTYFQSPVALLYQTGYLTIKKYLKESNSYVLGIPNKEVESGLFPYLLRGFTHIQLSQIDNLIEKLKERILKGNPEEFLNLLKSYLADVPTFSGEDKVSEKYFEHTLYLIFRTMGLKVVSQKSTSFNRSDLIVETEAFVYIFELKTQGKAEAALQQIEEKGYALPFEGKGKKLFKIGLVFSKKRRNISSWKISETL